MIFFSSSILPILSIAKRENERWQGFANKTEKEDKTLSGLLRVILVSTPCHPTPFLWLDTPCYPFPMLITIIMILENMSI